MALLLLVAALLDLLMLEGACLLLLLELERGLELLLGLLALVARLGSFVAILGCLACGTLRGVFGLGREQAGDILGRTVAVVLGEK